MLQGLFEMQGNLNKHIGYDTKSLKEEFDPVRESVEKATVALIDAADGTAIINGGGSNPVGAPRHRP